MLIGLSVQLIHKPGNCSSSKLDYQAFQPPMFHPSATRKTLAIYCIIQLICRVFAIERKRFLFQRVVFEKVWRESFRKHLSIWGFDEGQRFSIYFLFDSSTFSLWSTVIIIWWRSKCSSGNAGKLLSKWRAAVSAWISVKFLCSHLHGFSIEMSLG